jgi:hypothetical protein
MIRSRRMRLEGHAARIWEVENAYILVGKLEGKWPFGRTRRAWEEYIDMDHRILGCVLASSASG